MGGRFFIATDFGLLVLHTWKYLKDRKGIHNLGVRFQLGGRRAGYVWVTRSQMCQQRRVGAAQLLLTSESQNSVAQKNSIVFANGLYTR